MEYGVRICWKWIGEGPNLNYFLCIDMKHGVHMHCMYILCTMTAPREDIILLQYILRTVHR